MIDYYLILGVNEHSSQEEIKNAYRKLSKKFHPDVNDADKYFEERFKEIQNAYEILGDPGKRIKYNAKRHLFNKEQTIKGSYNPYDELLKREREKNKIKEDELNRREQELWRKEFLSQYDNRKKRRKVVVVFTVVSLFIIALVVTYNTNNYKKDDFYKDNDTVTLHSADINLNIKESNVISDLKHGAWTGEAYQFDIKENWNVTIIFNEKSKLFEVSYPSLGCSGNWYVTKVDPLQIEFKEKLTQRRNKCIDGGKVVLRRLSNSKMEYLYYSPNENVLNSKGTIRRIVF